MQQICINEECEHLVNEHFPIFMFHEDHKEDIITKQKAKNTLLDSALKIKQTISYLQQQLNRIEKVNVKININQELLENEKTLLKYYINNPFLFDQNKPEISFHTTTLIESQNIQQQSFFQFKNFIGKYKQLLNENIWCEDLYCLNHPGQKIHSLIIQPKVQGSRILCQMDDIQKGMILSKCKKLIGQYHEQEQAFEDMIKLKEQLCRLKVKIDNFASRMISWLTQIIQEKYETFKRRADDFIDNIQLKVEENYLTNQKVEHIALFLSIITKEGQIIQQINKEEIMNFKNLQKTIDQIENSLRQQLDVTLANKINLQLEVITSSNSEIKGYQLLTPNTIKLCQLFEWAKKENLIKQKLQITDLNVHINYYNYNIKTLRKEDIEQLYKCQEFKNDDLIQFEL